MARDFSAASTALSAFLKENCWVSKIFSPGCLSPGSVPLIFSFSIDPVKSSFKPIALGSFAACVNAWVRFLEEPPPRS
jgi:hypothetical protein